MTRPESPLSTDEWDERAAALITRASRLADALTLRVDRIRATGTLDAVTDATVEADNEEQLAQVDELAELQRRAPDNERARRAEFTLNTMVIRAAAFRDRTVDLWASMEACAPLPASSDGWRPVPLPPGHAEALLEAELARFPVIDLENPDDVARAVAEGRRRARLRNPRPDRRVVRKAVFTWLAGRHEWSAPKIAAHWTDVTSEWAERLKGDSVWRPQRRHRAHRGPVDCAAVMAFEEWHRLSRKPEELGEDRVRQDIADVRPMLRPLGSER